MAAVRTTYPFLNRFLLAAVVFLTWSSAASAQVITSTWTGATGNWTNPALWTPAVPNNDTPPGATYNAAVNGAGTLTVSTDIGIQRLDFPAGRINVQSGTFTINA